MRLFELLWRKEQGNEVRSLVSFSTHRRIVGGLGMAMPILVVFAHAVPLPGPTLKPDNECKSGLFLDTLSAYFWCGGASRTFFVATLFAVGLFLIAYRGLQREDDIVADIAGVSALGVALFPTKAGEFDPALIARDGETFVGFLHYAFAAITFIALAVISRALFTRREGHAYDMTRNRVLRFFFPRAPPSLDPRLRNRNRLYRICAWVIASCVVLIPLRSVLEGMFGWSPSIFLLEVVALEAFGISWMAKGFE